MKKTSKKGKKIGLRLCFFLYQVCLVNTRLAAVESMTHDVIRDLLGVKLDMTNYAVSLGSTFPTFIRNSPFLVMCSTF